MPLSFLKGIYQHNGAPTHKAINVINWLNKNYNRQWIDFKGPTEWHPTYPGLTPLDFFLWDRLRTQFTILNHLMLLILNRR